MTVRAVKAYVGAEVQLHSFLISPLDGGDGQLHTLVKTPALNRRLAGPLSQP